MIQLFACNLKMQQYEAGKILQTTLIYRYNSYFDTVHLYLEKKVQHN